MAAMSFLSLSATIFAAHGGVFTYCYLHILEALEELAALADGLLMGNDFSDVAHLGSCLCHEILAYAEPDASYDVEIIVLHEVVNSTY